MVFLVCLVLKNYEKCLDVTTASIKLPNFVPNSVNKKKSRKYKKQGIKNFLFLYYIQAKSDNIADKNPNAADDDK